MINRFKLLLLLLILAVLGVLFVQNQQPLSLKLLCPDINSSCLYQTPQLPLAIWIGLFLIGGVVTSLLWQLLNGFSYSSLKTRSYSNDVLYDNQEPFTAKSHRESPPYRDIPQSKSTKNDESISDWETREAAKNWHSSPPQTDNASPVSTTSEYEVRREPENVTVSGSTYSYKFKEASEKESQQTNTPNLNKQTDLDEDDEEWI